MRELSLYFHIPYCNSKCFYCDFNSYVGKQDTIKQYFECMLMEIDLYKNLHGSTIRTIFFGGGSPSVVETKYINKVIDKCSKMFNFDTGIEISIETNPESLTKQKLSDYKNMGINRLSIGIQAWQDKLLRRIGRIHDKAQFLSAFSDARNAGFDNINVDLIFSLPDQSIKDWVETLQSMISLRPEHLSCYSLKIEEGTKLYTDFQNGVLNLPDEDIDRKMYYTAQDILSQNGYDQYEISNFAKPGFECSHNLTYWTYRDYIGFGAGASSALTYKKDVYLFDDKDNSLKKDDLMVVRTENLRGIEEYINSINNNELPYKDKQILSKPEQMSEYMITGLRLIRGINKNQFYKRFGVKIDCLYKDIIDKYKSNGLLTDNGENIRLTKKGLDLSNIVMVEFI